MLEDTRHIHDGPENFPNSCVQYVRFANRDLRQFFSYLREREEILQRDLRRTPAGAEGALLRTRLEEVESILIFLAHNCDEARERSVTLAAYRRRAGAKRYVSERQGRLL